MLLACRILFFLFGCLMIFGAAAQTSAVPENVRASYNLDRFGDGIINEMIIGIPLEGGKVSGEVYIDEVYRPSRVILQSHKIPLDGYKVRYDLYKQELEVETKQGIKVVPVEGLLSFTTFDSGDSSLYMNASHYKFTDEYTGLLKLLYDGEMALAEGYEAHVKRPDYNEALNVGSRDFRVYRIERFYLIYQQQAYRIHPNKEKFMALLPDKIADRVATTIKQGRWKLTRQADLLEIFRLLNAKN